MGSRQECVARGIAPLNEVVEYLHGTLDDGDSRHMDIQSVLGAMANLLDGEGGEYVRTVLCCAVLNEQYRKTGWRFETLSNGAVNVDYTLRDSERELIAGALGL